MNIGALNYEEQEKRTRAIVSSETASILGALGLKGQPLDVRIRKLADERDDLGDTVRRLKVINYNCQTRDEHNSSITLNSTLNINTL